jgi:hypothetical protein
MKHTIKTWGRCLAIVTILALSAASNGAEFEEKQDRYWAVYATLHYASFDGLGDVQPAGRGGPFETSGPGIELGGYFSVAHWGSATLMAGMEIGLLGFNSDVILEDTGPVSAESGFEVYNWTLSLALRFGDSGKRYIDLDAGLGKYWGHTMYIDCVAIPSCFDADTRSESAGGYLGISGSPGYGIRFGVRAHVVKFDPIEAIGPGTGSLDGPIYTAFVGWEFGE